MLRWLLSEFRVRNTLLHNMQTALLSGWRCCCSLCLFRVSLVLSSFPQMSHRWLEIIGRGRLDLLTAVPTENNEPRISPRTYQSQACLISIDFFVFSVLRFFRNHWVTTVCEHEVGLL